MAKTNRLGLEMLTLLGMNPVEHVKLAAELGCAGVSIGMAGLDLSLFGLPPMGLYDSWSLLKEPGLRRELSAVLSDTGVCVTLGEGFLIAPNSDIASRVCELDIIASLGTSRINAISIDHDISRTYDQLAVLAELVTDRGMEFIVEFAPTNAIDTLSKASVAADYVGAERCGVMIDIMHLIRSGGTIEDVRALPPGRIRYAQLCDVPLHQTGMHYKQEAILHRLSPGEGELPLSEFLEVLPTDLHVGVEVPNLLALQGGISPHSHAANVIAAARSFGF